MAVLTFFLVLGSPVKATASEVAMILEHFNIQVNNPIAVLMQETTKAFLTTAKAKDKYKVRKK
jgi:hypothetical protein